MKTQRHIINHCLVMLYRHFPLSSGHRWVPLLLLLILTMTACQANILATPRLATATAQAAATATATAEPVVLKAPTPTGEASAGSVTTTDVSPNPVLTVWINEASAEHEATLQAMASEFTQQHAVNLELLRVSPSLLPDLVATAVLSNTLPDVILHPIEYTVGWTERGILSAAAADAVVDQLGRDTFNPAALELITVDGKTAAVPSDGYQQLLIYRADWFDEQDLAPPDNYETMITAADTLSDTTRLITGFIIPTESNLVTTHQAFEHIAAANGCQLIDEKGEVLILEPPCREALNFYFRIVNRYSPSGVQTDASARNAFLAGRTAMIMAPPTILPQLAGLDGDNLPTCPACGPVNGSSDSINYLAQNSGIITHISGANPSAPAANFGEIMVLGITQVADPEVASIFVNYWFSEGYDNWLAVETERKVPMRWGTAAMPRRFIDAWGTLPVAGSSLSLADIYGQEVVNQLREGVAESSRWGFRQDQGALITRLYEELTF
ncbi:MAG TPA: hypothetical protein VF177_17360, partial [Anaerolineae bacterium]